MMAMDETQPIYYHFVSANKRLRYDAQDTEVAVGLKLATDEPIALCEYGFHASKDALDALKDAPADAEWLCGVTLGGSVIHGDDKVVASERTVVWMLNVRKLLVEFAAWNVEQAFEAVRKLGIEPDARSIEAANVVRLWLVDKATDEEVRAAARAARAAADAAHAAAAADAAYAAQREKLEQLIQAATTMQALGGE
jgi:hypothetical protein